MRFCWFPLLYVTLNITNISRGSWRLKTKLPLNNLKSPSYKKQSHQTRASSNLFQQVPTMSRLSMPHDPPSHYLFQTTWSLYSGMNLPRVKRDRMFLLIMSGNGFLYPNDKLMQRILPSDYLILDAWHFINACISVG